MMADESAPANAEPLDPDQGVEFRRTLSRFPTGVTVITVLAGDEVHGMTANAFTSVSLQPPLVLVSVDKRARMHRLMHDGEWFGVSVLAHDQDALSEHYAGRLGAVRPDHRFTFVRGTPLVERAVAHVVARIVRSYWGGDHSLFLGQVEYAAHVEGRPLLFHRGHYERLPLAEVSILSAMPEDLRRAVVAAGTERSFPAGRPIVGRDDEGDVAFVVLDGRVRIERDGRTLATIGPGELFGEIAVLDGGPRTADAIADVDTRCLTVSGRTLHRIVVEAPEAGWLMLQVLASRLRGS
jgi:flavin reductase (DIM6/NTAB) family NADH-FMN oxidoreductase RutF